MKTNLPPTQTAILWRDDLRRFLSDIKAETAPHCQMGDAGTLRQQAGM
jgi:hypothetical protein